MRYDMQKEKGIEEVDQLREDLEEEQRMMDWHEKLQPPRPEVDEKLI
jgi:hypothetical protein